MNKKYSKNSLIIVLIIISISLSCVSSKKYDEALSSLARMKSDSTIAANELATVSYSRSSELLELRNELQEQKLTMDSLNNVLQRRQNKLNAITTSLKDAFPNLNEKNVSTNLENGYVHFSFDHRVLFNRGEQELASDGRSILTKLSGILQDAQSDVMILGHTDSLPYKSPNYDNWMLSLQRAHSVAEVLVDEGLNPRRLIIAGRSKYDPMFTNNHQIGRLLNRRIELILMPDMEKVEDLFAEYIK